VKKYFITSVIPNDISNATIITDLEYLYIA
jgi:hypothetical protein